MPRASIISDSQSPTSKAIRKRWTGKQPGLLEDRRVNDVGVGSPGSGFAWTARKRESYRSKQSTAKKFNLQSGAAAAAAARGVYENWLGDPAEANLVESGAGSVQRTGCMAGRCGSPGPEILRGLRKLLRLKATGVRTIPFCSRVGFRRCGRRSQSNAVTRLLRSRR